MARILALEPYYGGSHQAFLDGWQKHSRHEFTLLPLKAHHWKWRMRHAAVTLATEAQRLAGAHTYDAIWCSSMCNVAEFLGLCPPTLRQLPLVVYFHENQLVYPSQRTDPRDVHFAFTNWTTALAASCVWFNSAFNRDSLLSGLQEIFRRLPDHRDSFDAELIRAKTRVLAPGIEAPEFSGTPNARQHHKGLHIAWAARFEHDKGPDVLLQALRELREANVRFSLTLMGQQFGTCPQSLGDIEREFAGELLHFGFEPNRSRYFERLANADVFVSTAQHEFFGLSVLEAASAGCSLLLPRRLSYPELFTPHDSSTQPLFYDGSSADLVEQLKRLASMPSHARPHYRDVAERYAWPRAAQALDAGIQALL
jgi:glycosyltransferase involved in cell wall biosynthesis